MDKDFRVLVPRMKKRWTKIFAYGFMVAFVGCTAFLAFNPPGNGSPLNNFLFTPSFSATIAPYRSRFNSLISQYFPNSTSFSIEENPFDSREIGSQNDSVFQISTPTSVGSVNVIPVVSPVRKNHAEGMPSSKKDGSLEKNPTDVGTLSQNNGTGPLPITPEGSILKKDGILIAKNKTAIQIPGKNLTGSELALEKTVSKTSRTENETAMKENGVVTNIQQKSKAVSVRNGAQAKNETSTFTGAPSTNQKAPPSPAQSKNQTTSVAKAQPKNQTKAFTGNQTSSKIKEVPGSSNISGSFSKSNNSSSQASNGIAKKNEDWLQNMVGCDIFHGKWVQDDSYPLYSEGSCPHIDEPFDCFLNGRPDRAYQKLRWQPDACKIPRFNALDFLERLRGKRLVFVGDSLNRNMWESIVCGLRNSVKVKEKVFEASGRHDFRTEGSYSFLFKDYNCTVEFFRSPFLVQEWEIPDSNGKKKETLRLDIIERSSSRYKDANIIVFNTGHWWTHEKTSKGRDYYQEGNRVYSELNVVEAFHKALHTWAIWVDANVNPKKTLVFFRGYSASHFRGGQWNSCGACDKEKEPINNEKFLLPYPPKMRVLETVINGMKTPVSYLNITRMTDFRKDAHPSIYRKQNLTDEERREPERFQDCSHWCLPGVPDSWNELLYAQILIKQKQMPNW